MLECILKEMTKEKQIVWVFFFGNIYFKIAWKYEVIVITNVSKEIQILGKSENLILKVVLEKTWFWFFFSV